MRRARYVAAAVMSASLVFGGVAASAAPFAHVASAQDASAQDVNTNEQATVDVDYLNVRQTPSLSGTINKTLAYGTAVTVTAGPVTADGYQWYRLSQDGSDIGWSVAGFIALSDGSNPSGTAGQFAYGQTATVNTDALNVRSAPTLTASVLTVYQTGTQVKITGGPSYADNITWYAVDNLGWVAGQFLVGSDGSGDGGTPSQPSDDFTYGQMVVVNTDALNVRSQPSLSGSVLDVYLSGESATITGGPKVADNIVWYAVNNVGWVAGNYLVASTGDNGGGDTGTGFSEGDSVVVNTDAINVRSQPSLSGQVLDVYLNGETATITGSAKSADGYTWYPVNNLGYVAGQFLSKASGSGDNSGTENYAYGDKVTVNTDLLNVRALPSISADVLDVYAYGTAAMVTGGPKTADGYTWVALDNLGWVASTYLSGTGSGSAPTSAPTAAPTSAPTSAPTAAPTSAPTDAPTSAPTDEPTTAPTAAPTSAPTSVPTAAPTAAPTSAPSASAGTFSDGDKVVVTAARLNVRADTSYSANVVRIITKDTQLTVYGDGVTADGTTWYAIDAAKTEWVDGKHIAAA